MANTATWYHCSVKSISRSTGRTAIAAAAYRSGTRLHDNQLDRTYDYTRRRGVEETFILTPENAPAWSHDLERLWNEAQARDNRKNSMLAREIELALPSALDAGGRADLAREFSQHLVERYGVAVSAALHEPSRYGDENNYHAHILFTTRRMEGDGLGAKTRELDVIQTSRGEVEHLREYAASLINAYLEDAGSDERVDHRSYKDRGVEQESTEHLGVEAAAMERRGDQSRIGDENREIVEHNRNMERLVNAPAAVDAEIQEELAKEFSESEPPEIETLSTSPTAQVQEPQAVTARFVTGVPEPPPEEQATQEESKHSMVGGHPPVSWEEVKREAQSAWKSEVTRAYATEPAETSEQERQRKERSWYENIYSITVESVQQYWSKFVDKVISGREERDRDDYERER